MNVWIANDSSIGALIDDFIVKLVAGHLMMCQGSDRRSVGFVEIGTLDYDDTSYCTIMVVLRV